MAKSRAQELTEFIIASRTIGAPLRSLGDRAKRRDEKRRDQLYGILREVDGVNFQGEIVRSNITWEDDNKARGMKLGVEEFRQRHPVYGKRLQAMIDEHRKVRRAHLHVGFSGKEDLPREVYMAVLEDMGITGKLAGRVYDDAIAISNAFDKDYRADQTLLLPE